MKNIEELLKCQKDGQPQKEFKNNKRFSRIVFTLNNFKDSDIEKFEQSYRNKNLFSYIIYGKEKAPTTGTKHLQGYIEFTKQLSFLQVKNIHSQMYFDAAKGNYKQNYTYCSKSGDFVEFGFPKKQGARTDIVKIKQMVRDNISMNEILDECENYQQMRIAEKLIQYKKLDVKTRNVPEVIYIHGKSGSGKTEYAHNICDKNSTYVMNNKLDWFDGYDRDNDVIINDFRSSKCEYSTLLNLLDGYEMRVPIKGSFTIWNPKRIIFTSVLHPKNLYKGIQENDDAEDTIYQLLRRISKYVVCEKINGNFIQTDKTDDYKILIENYNH